MDIIHNLTPNNKQVSYSKRMPADNRNGKGSNRRKRDNKYCTDQQFNENWNSIFRKGQS